MALEFTRLSDVELVVEATETANVLIEEGGEIKRVPKTEVGGGKSEWDAVIKIINTGGDDDGISVVGGSYNAVHNKILLDNEVPRIKIISEAEVYYSVYYTVFEADETIIFEPNSENEYIVFYYYNCDITGEVTLKWHPDNTFTS